MGDRAKQTNPQGSLFDGESSTALATPETLDLRPARISVERNIEAWPIFVPSDSRSAPKVRRLVRKIKVDDNSVIEASVLVSFAADLGMLRRPEVGR